MSAKLYDGNKENAVGTITLEDGITSIDTSAFSYCERLEEIIFPNSVTSIGEYAFLNCISLRELNLPEGLTSINNWAFFGCRGLEKINFPKSLTSIDKLAFLGCANLKTITYYEKTEEILKEYFGDEWENLEKILIDEKLAETLENEQMTDVISQEIEKLFGRAQECDPDAVLMLKNVVTRGQDLIENLYYDGHKKNSSRAIILRDDVTSIDAYEFKDWDKLEKIILPEGLLTIYDNAFEGCVNLKTIDFPENLTAIGEEAFKDCYNLKEIIFNKNLTAIDKYAFIYCDGLEKIAYHKNTEELLKKCFGLKQWDRLEKIALDD